MAGVKRFEDLAIWQDSRILVNTIYRCFKDNNDRGFKDQIQRASVSVMNNIAEGFERGSDKDFVRFLYFAKASCGEVRSMIYLSVDLNLLTEGEGVEIINSCTKISGSIQNFIAYLMKNECAK